MVNKKRQRRLIESVLNNVGGSSIKAHRVVLYIACWGVCSKKLGRPPVNVEEYADWWNKTRATAYREQQLFREALPMHETPTAICEWLQETDPAIFNQAAGLAAFEVGSLL